MFQEEGPIERIALAQPGYIRCRVRIRPAMLTWCGLVRGGKENAEMVGTRAKKRLVGIVTDRDRAMKLVAPAHEGEKIGVYDVMSRPVVTCSPDA